MAAKKKSWYAVRRGRKTGLYTDWPECQRQVIGFTGAEFKGFYTKEEAEAYLAGTAAEEITADENIFTVYVDGSYDPALPDRYAFGAVFLAGGEVMTKKGCIVDPENARMRNVAGEIAGARCAMAYCIEHGIREMALYYDYAGLEKWCTGEWHANLPGTQALKAYYDSIKGELRVHFRKVKSHTGVKYNEMADRLAKAALEGK